MQALPILTQIWEQQVAMSNGNPVVYSNIGRILVDTGSLCFPLRDFCFKCISEMYAAGARQFLTGASRAFELQQYKLAVGLLDKAEAAVGKVMIDYDSLNASDRKVVRL
jgi:hypothetical protein